VSVEGEIEVVGKVSGGKKGVGGCWTGKIEEGQGGKGRKDHGGHTLVCGKSKKGPGGKRRGKTEKSLYRRKGVLVKRISSLAVPS